MFHIGFNNVFFNNMSYMLNDHIMRKNGTFPPLFYQSIYHHKIHTRKIRSWTLHWWSCNNVLLRFLSSFYYL